MTETTIAETDILCLLIVNNTMLLKYLLVTRRLEFGINDGELGYVDATI